jgi:hypothetical protein
MRPKLFGSGNSVTQPVRVGRRNRGKPNRIPIAVWLEMALRWSGPLGAEQESAGWSLDQRYPNALGGKPPTLQIGGKPPKILSG